VCRRENRGLALLEQRPVVDAGGHVLHVPEHCGVDLAFNQEIDELLRRAFARLDVKSRDELCDLRDRTWDLRRTAFAKANARASIGRTSFPRSVSSVSWRSR